MYRIWIVVFCTQVHSFWGYLSGSRLFQFRRLILDVNVCCCGRAGWRSSSCGLGHRCLRTAPLHLWQSRHPLAKEVYFSALDLRDTWILGSGFGDRFRWRTFQIFSCPLLLSFVFLHLLSLAFFLSFILSFFMFHILSLFPFSDFFSFLRCSLLGSVSFVAQAGTTVQQMY